MVHSKTSQHILVLAPTNSLHLDKRIVLSCNSLAESGHQVSILAEEHSPENTETARSLIHPSCELFFVAPLMKKQPGKILLLSKEIELKVLGPKEQASVFIKFLRRGIGKVLRFRARIFSYLAKHTFLASSLGFFTYLRTRKSLKLGFWNYLFIRKAFEIHQAKPIELIFSNDLWSLGAGIALKEGWGLPLVFDAHEIGTTIYSDPRLKRLAEKQEGFMYRAVDKMLTVNDSVANYYSNKFPFLSPKVIINAPKKSPTPRATQCLKKRLGLNESKLGVMMGHLGHPFGIDKMMEAMNHCNKDFCLAVLGQGPSKDFLLQTAKKLGLLNERVFFLNPIPFAEVVDYMRGADFGVCPDKRYLNNGMTSPSKLYEYVQAELPVLSSFEVEVHKLFSQFNIGSFLDFDLPPSKMADQLDSFLIQLESGAFTSGLLSARDCLIWPENYAEIVLSELIPSTKLTGTA